MRYTFGELLSRAGSGSTCSTVPAWDIVRLFGGVGSSVFSGSCLRLGEDPLVWGCLARRWRAPLLFGGQSWTCRRSVASQAAQACRLLVAGAGNLHHSLPE
eukprot:7409690-Pyramimonas_sp.AAC.1